MILKIIEVIVLKLGPDRSVELVWQWTGGLAGSVHLSDRLCYWAAVNRSNSAKTGNSGVCWKPTGSTIVRFFLDKETRGVIYFL